ncbi:unnamed protein product [Ixodes pacificus]
MKGLAAFSLLGLLVAGFTIVEANPKKCDGHTVFMRDVERACIEKTCATLHSPPTIDCVGMETGCFCKRGFVKEKGECQPSSICKANSV